MQHFIDKCNKALAEKLQKHKGEMVGLRTTERVRTAIQWRLEMIIPYMSKAPKEPAPILDYSLLSKSPSRILRIWG